jgi:tetratricopeptide (TPR) repeat protein
MASVLGRVFRVVGYPGRVVRRRWKLVLLGAVVLVIAAGGGGYAYALREWEAARAAVKDDRPQDARDRLVVCLAVWPRSPDVHLLAARAARQVQDFPAAEAHLNRCLELAGATTAVQIEFLLLRTQTGEVDAVAPALLHTADTGHPEAPLILETLARAYMHRLQYKQAYGCLTRWIELEPAAVKPYHWRGWVYERLDHATQAMDDYLKVLELDPDRVQVRLRVAEMLLEDKQPQEALAHLELLARQDPDRPDVQARLGQCYFLLGRGADARRLLEAAVAHLPDDPSLLLHLGKLDLQEGRPAEAETWLRRILVTEKTDTEAEYTLASALQAQGKTAEAAAVLKQYEEHKALLERANQLLKDIAKNRSRGPEDPSELGRLFLSMGRDRMGLHWLDEALKRNPDHQATHKVLADYYAGKGDARMADLHRARLHPPDQAANR